MRRIDCGRYSDCLDKVAKADRDDLDCGGCGKYSGEGEIGDESIGERKEDTVEGQLKICTKCRVEKPMAQFGKGIGKNKLRYICKECEKNYLRAYRARKKTGAGDETHGTMDQVREPMIANDGVESKAKALADAHWSYVGGLLKMHGQEELEKIEYHYKTAMIHGYKHGVQEAVK